MSLPLNGKIAIITGAAMGIGAATAKTLARAGALVVVTDIKLQGAEAVANEISANGGKSIARYLDIGDHAGIERLAGAIIAECGGIDIAVNNAVQVDPEDGQVADNSADLWLRQLGANLVGPAMLSRAVLPSMIARGGGALVHVSSVAGIQAEDTRSCYSAAKAGVLGLSRSIAVQYGKQGVRSNCVAPGLILTPAARQTFSPEMLQILREHQMTPDLGEPEHIADTILFLCSPAAAFINGHVLLADGGATSAVNIVPAFRNMR